MDDQEKKIERKNTPVFERQATLPMEEDDNQEETKNDQDKKAWAKMTSFNPTKYPHILLSEEIISLGRNETNTVAINDKKLSGNHCKIIKQQDTQNKDNFDVFIEDLSTNGTFHNDKKIGRNNKMKLQNGDTIYLLHPSKVGIDETIGYVFSCTVDDKKRKQPEPDQELQEQLEKKTKVLDEIKKQVEDLGDNMKCCICLDYIYQCVTLIDCLHNFCGACYSDWMKKSKDCPQCRKPVIAVKKNAQINDLIEQYLNNHQDKKRPKEEYAEMDKKNKITLDTTSFQDLKQIFKKEKKSRRRNRGYSDSDDDDNDDIDDEDDDFNDDDEDDEDDDEEQKINSNNSLIRPLFAAAAPIRFNQCQECINPRQGDGFQCPQNQYHVACWNCAKLIPKRNDVPQQIQCVICNGFCCNLYFNACIGFKNIMLYELKNHLVPVNLDPNNGKTTQHIYDHIMENYTNKDNFTYKCNKSIIKDYPFPDKVDKLKGDSLICTACFAQVWFQFVFNYTIDIKKDLPAEVSNRGDCWYGINCRTMVHNLQHAQRLNHICLQTKFD